MIKQALYFAYGANLNKKDMAHRCPGAKPIGAATLKDHRLTFRGVADIEAAPGETVHGAVWVIDDQHLARLDRFEGCPNFYTREWVEVTTANHPYATEQEKHIPGTTLKCLVYTMVGKDHTNPPTTPYFNAIAEGYTDFNLPHSALTQALAGTYEKQEGRRTG